MAEPQTINYRTTNLPDYLDKPYQEYMGLYGGQVAADLKAGMPQYQQERIAGLSEVQQKAMKDAMAMQPSQQINAATGLMGAATTNALNTNYKPGEYNAQNFGNQVGGYMSPYMQNVVDIQQREAQRQADIASTGRNAQAVKSGAFGGSRQALTDAEAARNLALQKGDIQAKGLQDAFTQASNQYNIGNQLSEQSRQYGAGLGLQGQQAAMQGAGAMGTLGNLQYQQQMGINQLQQGYGGMQQNIEQQRMNTAYQDFLNKQNYPYQLLNQYGNVLNRQPANMNVMQTTYGQSPSLGGQIIGTAGALATSPTGSKIFGFAEGGIADSRDVTDESYIAKLIEKLSLPQLQAILGNPAAPKMEKELASDQIERLQRIQASAQRGLYGAAQNTPSIQEMYPEQEVHAANGGIVAFADRGAVVDPDELTPEDYKTLPSLSDIRDFFTPKAALENRRKYEAGVEAEKAAQQPPKAENKPPVAVGTPSKPANKPASPPAEPTKKADKSDTYLADLMKQFGGTDAKGLSSALKGLPSSYKDEVYKSAKELGVDDKAVLDKLDKMLGRDQKRSEDFKNDSSRMYWNQFFSGIAQASAEPGQKGVRGIMTAVSKSAGRLPEYEATLRKQQDQYDMLAEKNEIDNLKYKVALKNQRFDEALGLEKAIKENQYQMAHLQQQAAATAAHTKLGLAQLAEQHGYHQMLGDVYSKRAEALKEANRIRLGQIESKIVPMFQADRGARELAAALRKQYGDNWQQQAEPQRQYQQYYNSFKAKALPSLMSEGAGGVQSADALLGVE